MPAIRPVSDLRNYTDVFKEVRENRPVYLTKNDRRVYAIVDIAEYENYEKTTATFKLMCELQKGRLSGEQNGWFTEEDVEKHFKDRNTV